VTIKDAIRKKREGLTKKSKPKRSFNPFADCIFVWIKTAFSAKKVLLLLLLLLLLLFLLLLLQVGPVKQYYNLINLLVSSSK